MSQQTQGVLAVAPRADLPRFRHMIRKSMTSYKNGGGDMGIYEANKPMSSGPDKIYPRQVLRIAAQGWGMGPDR